MTVLTVTQQGLASRGPAGQPALVAGYHRDRSPAPLRSPQTSRWVSPGRRHQPPRDASVHRALCCESGAGQRVRLNSAARNSAPAGATRRALRSAGCTQHRRWLFGARGRLQRCRQNLAVPSVPQAVLRVSWLQTLDPVTTLGGSGEEGNRGHREVGLS